MCELNFIRFYHFLNVESLFEQKLTGVKQHRLKVDSSVPLTGGGAEASTRRLEGKEIFGDDLRSCLIWESLTGGVQLAGLGF